MTPSDYPGCGDGPWSADPPVDARTRLVLRGRLLDLHDRSLRHNAAFCAARNGDLPILAT